MNAIERQVRIGLGVAVFAFVAFFVWGQYFHLFGSEITLTGPTLGFFGWILLMFFGIGFTLGGPRGGMLVMLSYLAILGVAFGIGVLNGAYR